jgi:hypothetical protein
VVIEFTLFIELVDGIKLAKKDVRFIRKIVENGNNKFYI